MTSRTHPRLLVAALIAAAACAHRGPDDGRVADPAVPPKAAFELYPVEQIAGVRDPHDYKGKALCQRCHLPNLKLTMEANALCKHCHSFRHGNNHPVDVVQKTPAPGLPLLSGGKVACHTCHDPHQGKQVLRLEFDALCKTCHRGH